jgi:hypothetical protein
MDDAPHVEVLGEHVRRALVHELGTTSVEAWLGKDGEFRHDVADLARITMEELAPWSTTFRPPSSGHHRGRLGTSGGSACRRVDPRVYVVRVTVHQPRRTTVESRRQNSSGIRGEVGTAGSRRNGS